MPELLLNTSDNQGPKEKDFSLFDLFGFSRTDQKVAAQPKDATAAAMQHGLKRLPENPGPVGEAIREDQRLNKLAQDELQKQSEEQKAEAEAFAAKHAPNPINVPGPKGVTLAFDANPNNRPKPIGSELSELSNLMASSSNSDEAIAALKSYETHFNENEEKMKLAINDLDSFQSRFIDVSPLLLFETDDPEIMSANVRAAAQNTRSRQKAIIEAYDVLGNRRKEFENFKLKATLGDDTGGWKEVRRGREKFFNSQKDNINAFEQLSGALPFFNDPKHFNSDGSINTQFINTAPYLVMKSIFNEGRLSEGDVRAVGASPDLINRMKRVFVTGVSGEKFTRNDIEQIYDIISYSADRRLKDLERARDGEVRSVSAVTGYSPTDLKDVHFDIYGRVGVSEDEAKNFYENTRKKRPNIPVPGGEQLLKKAGQSLTGQKPVEFRTKPPPFLLKQEKPKLEDLSEEELRSLDD